MQRIKLASISNFFNLPRLGYAVTTPYPWRHFNLVAFTTSIIFLVFLTLVNVQAVGYESISAPSDYLLPTQRPWWSPSRFLQPTPICDPHQILQGDTFRTNISNFDYAVDYINTTVSQPAGDHPDSVPHSGLNGLQYAADSLAIACDEQAGNHRLLKVTVDALQRKVTGSVEINCSFTTPDSESVMAVTASQSMAFAEVDDTLFGPPLLADPGIKRVLQVLALDVAESVVQNSQTFLSATGVILCPGNQDPVTPAQLQDCHNNPAYLFLTAATPFYPNGTQGQLFDRTSIQNYLQGLSAASLADTGIWHNNSIFVSPDIVNATLQPGSNANELRTNRSSSFGTITPTPAIIALTYTCHFQRRKPALNFIVSVLVADLSIFATFWAVFNLVASSLARSKISHKGQDVETGGAMSTQDYTTSERFPMIHRSPSTEFIEMGSAVLASSYISETLPMIHRDSTDKSMPGEGEVDHKSS